MAGFSAAEPVIAGADVEGTVAWFETTPGFERQWSWGDPAVYAGIRAGEAELYVCEDVALAPATEDLIGRDEKVVAQRGLHTDGPLVQRVIGFRQCYPTEGVGKD
jgi:hypothetical protein